MPIAGLHHATRDSAAGFCVFNDCGIAIEALRQRHGIRRVAYVDIDAHHGNGTQDIFYNDQCVLYISTHQFPHYPGSGSLQDVGRDEAMRSWSGLGCAGWKCERGDESEGRVWDGRAQQGLGLKTLL